MLPVLLATLAAAAPTVDCASHVEGREPTAEERRAAGRWSITAHGATFFGLRHAALENFRRRRANKGYKAGLGVTYGAPLRIKVAMRDRAWLALDYDRETKQQGVGAPEIRVVPCSPDTPRFSDDGVVGNETGWAGGFVVQREGCATLLLRREGEKHWRRVRVGFGRACRQ
jgi:hypothetical protein